MIMCGELFRFEKTRSKSSMLQSSFSHMGRMLKTGILLRKIESDSSIEKGEVSMITGRLGYNSDNDRYGLLVLDLWEREGFQCGEGLEVMVDGKWIATRMEMSADREWYLVGTDYKGDLEYIRARI